MEDVSKSWICQPQEEPGAPRPPGSDHLTAHIESCRVRIRPNSGKGFRPEFQKQRFGSVGGAPRGIRGAGGNARQPEAQVTVVVAGLGCKAIPDVSKWGHGASSNSSAVPPSSRL